MNSIIEKNGLCKLKVPITLVEQIVKSIFHIYDVNTFEDLTSKINNLSDEDFSKISKKTNRFLSKEICLNIEKWIKESKELKNILNYKEIRISNISPYENNERGDLDSNHLDIFFRLVRQNKNDIGPPHYDELFWGQVKNTKAEVRVSHHEERWKIWIPLEGVNEKNSLELVKGSHLENVPWHMTNTSEPHSDDMVEQANNPVSFDWMVKGICGLSSVPQMMEKVEAEQPFGSFYSFTELEDLPYVETDSQTFRNAAEGESEQVKAALMGAADELESNGECWSRKVEEELYKGYGLPHPLNLS